MFKIDRLLNTRQLGLYYYTDFNEREIGVAIWNRTVGVQLRERKPRFSRSKYEKSINDLSLLIETLNKSQNIQRDHLASDMEHSHPDTKD